MYLWGVNRLSNLTLPYLNLKKDAEKRMKKLTRTFIRGVVLSSVMLISACATYQISKDFNGQQIEASDSGSTPIAYIHAKNYGYYLFNVIPLISGDCEKVGSTRWFTDNVNPHNSVDILTKKARELGAAKVVNIATTHRESGAFTFWVFWYRGAQSSGTAVK